MNSTPAEAPVTSSTSAATDPLAKAGPAQTNKNTIVNRMDFIVQSPHNNS
jgi:hypothetical protein